MSKQRSRNHELCRNKAQEVLENKGFDWTQLQRLINRKGINFYVTAILIKPLNNSLNVRLILRIICINI